MEIKGCACGRRHICDVDAVNEGCGALSHIAPLIVDKKGVLLVADGNTYEAFRREGGSVAHPRITECIFPASPLLVPDEAAVSAIEQSISPDTDTLVGIGGGTINDLCKYVAYKHGLYYIYVATAPSMDGYASDGAALIQNGMKVTVKTQPPRVLICDTNILKNAPLELIRAGVGDILGKFSCLNDWLLAAHIKGEYFCRAIYDRVMETAVRVADSADSIIARDAEGIALLTHALIQVGIEMSYAGSSRPASGSEHHMAHFFEIHALEHGAKHRPHGIDVGQASYYTALLRDAILKTDKEPCFCFDSVRHFESVKRLLPRAAEGIVDLQAKTALHGSSDGDYCMDGIKAVLEKAPRADAVMAMLKKAGLGGTEMIEFYGAETVENAMKYGKELKDRFTVLWLYEYLGWEMLNI